VPAIDGRTDTTPQRPEPTRPPFSRSASLTYGSNVAVASLSLVSVLITSRALGPSGRGQIAFLTTVGYLTAQLSTVGIQQAVINIAGRRTTLSATLAGNSVVLSALFGGIAALAVAVLFAAVPAAGGDAAGWLKALVLASVPMLVLQVCLQFLAQAHYLFSASNAAWLLVPAVMVAVNGTLAALGALSVATAVGAWIGGQALATLVLATAIVRRVGRFGRPDRALAREMVAFGARAHLGRIMLVGNYRLDQWILGSIAGTRALGVYSVAVAWSEVLFFLPTALSAVQRPDLVRASPGEARRQASDVLRMALLITAPLIVGLVVLAPFLCTTVFGGGFRGAVPELRILALAAPGIVALKLLGNALTAQGAPMRETAAIGVAFAAIVALDALLIPAHAGVGAAVASTIAYTAGGVAAGIIFLGALGGRPGDLVPRRRDIGTLAEHVSRVRRRLASGRRRSPTA
jgi:O-antigen/teichoic acid export membrane protein